MGMKKSNAIGLVAFAMAMSAASTESFEITERGSVEGGGKPKEPKPKKQTPFHKQEGIVKMIKDYAQIKDGNSKKGLSKQNRIVEKIEAYLKSGMLNEEHLKL